ncbi:helix-turn-helix domain-containing protein [Alkalinema sp. FACHB-956]|uniref:XRE family transcriptional regulator n=1 Tax=Alkalinema sp. FACHB-956 TaxID=2692768 RepID=UPI001689B348|nr:helix-turn-helix domain-containing protein [Alkalinema sp. FACHB-956]MBD2327321.1 XRE family transcriptional regulator [Alkalinema sp. FACHB-956]
MMNPHMGSNFDDFLEEEGILVEVESIAWKRVIAFQITQLMEEQNLTKTDMAKKMNTSRAALDRLLDPTNTSATLNTLEQAAIVLGKRLRVELV